MHAVRVFFYLCSLKSQTTLIYVFHVSSYGFVVVVGAVMSGLDEIASLLARQCISMYNSFAKLTSI